MNRILIGAAAAIVLAGFAGESLAQQDPAAIAQARHEHFKQIGAAAKGISDQLKSGKPVTADVQAYAKRINDLAPQLPSWFPAGTGPDAGIKTHAKAEVWKKPDEFKADAHAFAVEAHKLNVAAMSGDMAAVGAQMNAVNKACKTCHMTFREKED